jgi:hypothetical protein
MTGHRPSVPQTPLQQSEFSLQTSPPARQTDGRVQRFVSPTSSHEPEQQAAAELHASPADTQRVPTETQI